MTENIQLALCALAGMLLGALFFGGLYLTVIRAVSASAPALWFAVSLLLRTAATLWGFYFLADGDWRRLAAALAGFIIARMLIARLTRPKGLSCI